MSSSMSRANTKVNRNTIRRRISRANSRWNTEASSLWTLHRNCRAKSKMATLLKLLLPKSKCSAWDSLITRRHSPATRLSRKRKGPGRLLTIRHLQWIKAPNKWPRRWRKSSRLSRLVQTHNQIRNSTRSLTLQ